MHFFRSANPSSSSPAGIPGPTLEGTYRLDYNLAAQTFNGSPNPPPENEPQTETAYWAYRSVCTAKGCVATATGLDDTHKVASTPNVSSVWHYADDEWQRTPERLRGEYENCSVQGDKEIAGGDTEMWTWSMKPQSDGTLRGLRSYTVITSECGIEGGVRQDPFVATRIDDVPPGVAVADPATAAERPTSSTPSPAIPGPVLHGTYRLDFDYLGSTNNKGVSIGDSGNGTQWWAFRSICTTSGCVATGARLDDANHQETTGVVQVLRFDNGHWRDVPLTQRMECGTSRGPTTDPVEPTVKTSITFSRDFVPQPDGTLKGVLTLKNETNECGLQGLVTTTPVAAMRVGDVPSTVILADPTLFAS